MTAATNPRTAPRSGARPQHRPSARAMTQPTVHSRSRKYPRRRKPRRSSPAPAPLPVRRCRRGCSRVGASSWRTPRTTASTDASQLHASARVSRRSPGALDLSAESSRYSTSASATDRVSRVHEGTGPCAGLLGQQHRNLTHWRGNHRHTRRRGFERGESEGLIRTWEHEDVGGREVRCRVSDFPDRPGPDPRVPQHRARRNRRAQRRLSTMVARRSAGSRSASSVTNSPLRPQSPPTNKTTGVPSAMPRRVRTSARAATSGRNRSASTPFGVNTTGTPGYSRANSAATESETAASCPARLRYTNRSAAKLIHRSTIEFRRRARPARSARDTCRAAAWQ